MRSCTINLGAFRCSYIAIVDTYITHCWYWWTKRVPNNLSRERITGRKWYLPHKVMLKPCRSKMNVTWNEYYNTHIYFIYTYIIYNIYICIMYLYICMYMHVHKWTWNMKSFFNETLNFLFRKFWACYVLDFAQTVWTLEMLLQKSSLNSGMKELWALELLSTYCRVSYIYYIIYIYIYIYIYR